MKLKNDKTIKPSGYRITVKPFDIELQAGSVTFLEGENGGGKSTVLKLLAGVLIPDVNLSSFFEGDTTKTVRGFFQPIPFDPQLNLEKNLKVWGITPEFDHDLFRKTVEELALLQHMKTRWGACSSGTRQKFGMAVALAQPADVYLLDEPLAHLDKTSVDTINRMVNEKLENGCSFIVATHLRKKWAVENIFSYLVQDGKVEINESLHTVN